MTKVLHLCPRNSLFAGKVEKYARLHSEAFFLYETTFDFYSKVEFLSIWRALQKHPGHHVVFHRVPSWTVTLLNLFFSKLQYSLFYWGDDYYLPILNSERLKQHCVQKSPFRSLLLKTDPELAPRNAAPPGWGRRTKAFLKLRIAAYAASHAQCIYASPKQYRYVRYVHHQMSRSSVFCRHNQQMTMYADVELPASVSTQTSDQSAVQSVLEKKSLTVLVCHSGTSEVNVSHSLALLSEMARRRQCDINVVGYLSYAGGDDARRDQLEKTYTAQAQAFSKSVRFERQFLTSQALSESFEKLDIAFFSAYRDEGLTLLNMLSVRQIPLCFNRFSINYDYFKAKRYPALLTHEQAIGDI